MINFPLGSGAKELRPPNRRAKPRSIRHLLPQSESLEYHSQEGAIPGELVFAFNCGKGRAKIAKAYNKRTPGLSFRGRNVSLARDPLDWLLVLSDTFPTRLREFQGIRRIFPRVTRGPLRPKFEPVSLGFSLPGPS